MPETIFEVVAKIGNAADIPLLTNGCIAYDIDTKTFRVGDETPEPTKIPTNKTTGEIEFDISFIPTYGGLNVYAGGLTDGIDLKTFRQMTGMVLYNADYNRFFNVQFETDEYIQIENQGIDSANDPNPNTKIRFSLSDELLNKIGTSGGGVPYFWGEEPPESAPKGSLFYSTSLETLHILIADNDDNPDTWNWVDIQSVGSKFRNGGVTFFTGILPPVTASIGDEWHDSETNKTYKYFSDTNGFYWRELLI